MGWLIGLAVGLVAVLAVGVGVLFAATFGVMHSDGGHGYVVYWMALVVIPACLWLAYVIKRTLTRQR